MYLEQLYNELKRPIKIFVNQIDLWDDFKEYNISQYCEFYIYITSSFSLHRFRNYNNIHPIYELPKNQKFEGILINSEYIYNQLKKTNIFNFIIANNYLNSIDKKNIIESFQYQFIIYKSQQDIETDNIKIIPEEQTNIDHTIYLSQKNFAQNYKPKVFIITPIYNQSQWTIKCIDSINKYAEQKYDITHVLVDNGSNEQNKNNLNKFIENIHNIKIHFINFDKPIGFVKATNAGIKYALQHNADYIDLQNNDTEVSYNWMSKLINGIHGQIVAASPIIIQYNALESYKDSFINFPADLLNKQPTQVSNILTQLYPNLQCIVSKSENIYHLNAACFCCTMFNAEIFKYFLLDECFGIGYADDADYTTRLIQYNLKFIHIVNCAITHYSQKTFSKIIDQDKIKKIQIARLWQANTINKLNTFQEKSTVIYTVNPYKINNINDYKYYDLKNCDYIYITIPENANKIPKNWKYIDLTLFLPIIQSYDYDIVLNYFKLNPNLLFRNYKTIIYINYTCKLNMFPQYLNTIADQKKFIMLNNNTTNFLYFKNKKIYTDILNNIFNEYKLNKSINILSKIIENISNISYIDSNKYFNNNNEISFSKIKILSLYDNDNAITYYRLFTPYNYLKYIGFDVQYIHSLDFSIESCKNIKYFLVRREIIEYILQNQQLKQKFLILKNKLHVKIIYDTDDLLYNPPSYNIWYKYINKYYGIQNYKKAYEQILTFADIITVSTDNLKRCLINDFKLNQNKIYVLNNYLDKNFVDYTKIIPHKFNENKLTIGIISSSTHITNSGQPDDYSNLYQWFENNINKYNFIFFGAIPKNLLNYNNVKFIKSCNYKQYTKLILQSNIDIIITSLADNEFNKCKSNIKVIQACAFKIPIITNKISTYKENKYKFNTTKQLDILIKNICSTQENYLNIINQNYNFLLKNYIIYNNIDKYIKILKGNI